jgi:hypothetical protein
VWIVTDDERLEVRCEALDGVQVPLGAAFVSGVQAPPLHPNCRCAVGLSTTPPRRREEGEAESLVGVPVTTPVWDPMLRTLMRRARQFWDMVEAANPDDDPDYEDIATAMAKFIHGRRGVTVRTFSQTLDRIGVVLAGYDDKKDRIELNSKMSKALGRVVNAGLRGTRQDATKLHALETLVHEALHARSLGRYNNENDVAFEEGMVELMAQRWTMALISAGSRLSRPKFHKKITAYREYVEPMRWFERTFGNRALMKLWENKGDRSVTAAQHLKMWIPVALSRHKDPKVREHAETLAAGIRRFQPETFARLLQLGVWQHLEKWNYRELLDLIRDRGANF